MHKFYITIDGDAAIDMGVSKDFREVLRGKIEEALDYGFNNHIPLTSDYLADRLVDVMTNQHPVCQAYKTLVEHSEGDEAIAIEEAIGYLGEALQ